MTFGTQRTSLGANPCTLEDHSPHSPSAYLYELDADGQRMVRKAIGLQCHHHSPDRQPGRIW